MNRLRKGILLIYRVLIILTVVQIAWACHKNLPPVISGISCSPETRSAGTLFTFKAIVSNEAGTLEYRWTANGGQITDSVNKDQTTWKSPVDGDGKIFIIKVTVTNGKLETYRDYSIQLTQPVFGYAYGYTYFANCSIPVSGVTVSIDDKTVKTDSTGYFRLLNIPVGNYKLNATLEDFDPVSLNIDVLHSEMVKVIVSMTSVLHSSHVSGIVRDQDQTPIADARVVMLDPDHSESRLIAYTNSSGYYLLLNVPVGQRAFLVKKSPNENYGFEEVTLDLAITAAEYPLDIEMQRVNLKGDFVDTRDSHRYAFKIIGSQTWMAENLAYLPAVSISSDGSDSSNYYYVSGYEGTSVTVARSRSNYVNYGVLYNWPAARDACPDGWHLPGDTEWKALENYLGPNAAFHLKSTYGWIGLSNGDNSSGFNAIPGGERIDDLGFTSFGSIAHFWSSILIPPYGAWTRELSYDNNELQRLANNKRYGYSVRCLKN